MSAPPNVQFEHVSVPRIIFGRGQFARIGEAATALGRRAAVVHNADAAIGKLTDLLRQAGVEPTILRQRGEPTVADVDRGVAVARQAGCELLVALGGGSAIDAGKAIAGLLTNGGQATDYMEVVGLGRKLAAPALPWIAVPTTAGTGAEATRNTVLALPERRFKASIRSEHLLARLAVVDPELGTTVPPRVTACSGMDALCQLIESYTSTAAQPITDAMALTGIRLAGESLGLAYADGGDLDARESMALAALLSGIALTNAGLGAVHGFAAPLGGNSPAPHGAICAALLPHIMRANIAALRAADADHPTLGRYAEIGRALAGRPDLKDSPASDAGIDFAERLADELQIPPLRTFGLSAAAVPAMVALASQASSMKFNPVALPEDVLADVLLAAIG